MQPHVENPFRDGGELSKDAEDIIVALRTGKLSVLSNTSQEVLEEQEVRTPSPETSLVPRNERKSGVLEPAVRKQEEKEGEDEEKVKEENNNNNSEFEVERGVVVNHEHKGPVEHVILPKEGKEKRGHCCLLM